MISPFCSFEIINVAKPDPKIFFLKAASVTAAAAFDPNGTKAFLANGLSKFSTLTVPT